MENVWKQLCRPAEWLRCYFSQVLEREVSMHQTMCILHAQLAGTVAVFFTFDSVLLHLAAVRGSWQPPPQLQELTPAKGA